MKMTELLEELEEKRKRANSDAEKFKQLRDQKNKEARTWVQKRDELNAQVRDLIDEGNELKETRNTLNEEVKDAKVVRNKMNDKVKDLTTALQQKKEELLPNSDTSIKNLERDIRRLEFKQQTSVLSTEKERELVDKISSLREEVMEKKSVIEGNSEIQGLIKELDEAEKVAEEAHEKVSKNADQAQELHEKMLKIFDDADRVRTEADEAQKKFVDAKVKADEYHQLHIDAVNEIQDYNKMLWGLRKKKRVDKRRKDEIETHEKAEKLYEQFKKGEKLGTEDIMVLQKAGLL